jgi:SAM-dependent methyltransferase
MLAKLYGPIAIQYGAPDFSQFLQSSNAIRRIHSLSGRVSQESTLSGALLYSLPSTMPFGAKSVNLLILPHVLEFSADPHQVLREAERVLVPEGHLVLVCFNPNSLWGICKSMSYIVNKEPPAPWGGRFFGLSRVKDWLSVLGFEVISGSSVCFAPPVKSSNVRARLGFLDKAGARWWPMWAAVFILVVRKREIGLTPLVVGWTRRQRISPGLAEPVTKNG